MSRLVAFGVADDVLDKLLGVLEAGITVHPIRKQMTKRRINPRLKWATFITIDQTDAVLRRDRVGMKNELY
jgi:hypothetical protein